MHTPRLEPRQQLARTWCDMSSLIILPGKLPDSLYRLEAGNRSELDFVAHVPSQDGSALETRNRVGSRQKRRTQKLFVQVGGLGAGGPTAPHPGDHRYSPVTGMREVYSAQAASAGRCRAMAAITRAIPVISR